MNIKNTFYLAYHKTTGELYETYKGKRIWKSIGSLRTSVIAQTDKHLEDYVIAQGVITKTDKNLSLLDLKQSTLSIRELQQQIEENERKIDQLKSI